MAGRPRSRVIRAKVAVGVAAGALASGLTGALVASPASAATSTVFCLGQTNNLQAAIDSAPQGSTINVLGICTGSFFINPNQDITLYGGILDGANVFGQVLFVDTGSTATLNSLIIQHGNNMFSGGGIRNFQGTVNLNSSSVSNNSAGSSGGIDNFQGTVNLNSSSVSKNMSLNFGGGIGNEQGTVNVTSSSVSNNTAQREGGGIDNEQGTAHLVSSLVAANASNGGSGTGGGIFNDHGLVTLLASLVFGNTPDNCAPPGSVSGCSG